MKMNLDKLVSSRCPTVAQIMIQQEALLIRTSKIENYVKYWVHCCFYGGEKKTLILLENP